MAWQRVIYRENSESIGELRIHSCMWSTIPFGGNVLVLCGHLLRWGIRWLLVRAVKTLAFTPVGAEGLPFSPTKGWIHHSTHYDQKHLNVFGADSSCFRGGGRILKDQKFPKTELYSRSNSVSACLVIYWITRPPFSL